MKLQIICIVTTNFIIFSAKRTFILSEPKRFFASVFAKFIHQFSSKKKRQAPTLSEEPIAMSLLYTPSLHGE